MLESQPTYANMYELTTHPHTKEENGSKDSKFQTYETDSKPIHYSYTHQSTTSEEQRKNETLSPEYVKNQHESSNNDIQKEEEHLSPIIDVKSIGSVLDRASMFEKKLEKQKPTFLSSYHPNNHIANHALNLSRETVARLESIYGKRTEEVMNSRVDKSENGGEIQKK